MAIWIKNPLGIWTANNSDATNGVVIEGSKIVELVPKYQAPKTYYDQEFDASQCVVLPGLINCHHHFYQTLTRCFPGAQDKELFAWLRSLYPVWAKLDERAIWASTKLAAAELMLSGCTFSSDHHYILSSDLPDAVDIQIAALEGIGMRAIFTRGSMSLGQSSGGLPPDEIVQTDDEILESSERLLKKVKGSNRDFIDIALAPCSPFSVTPELMASTAQLARKHQALLHTHLCETEDENAFCLRKYGMRPVDYLDSVGWMSDDVWLAHGIHFNSDEMQRLGKAGVSVSHCPSSNMLLASGICPTLELAKAGVTLGLGVDGSASNDASNMIHELRQAFLLQRLKYGSERISHQHVLTWATKGGAQLFKRSDIGEISEGKQADIAFFKLDELQYSGACDPVAALIYCGAQKVTHLMINGNWCVKDSQIEGFDLAKLKADHMQVSQRLTRGK